MTPEMIKHRADVRDALSPAQAFLCTLVGEVLAEPIEGILAVAACIRNRVRLDLYNDTKPDWWGEGYDGVCLRHWQFSCWWEDSPNSTRVYEVAEALVEGRASVSVSAPRLVALEIVVDMTMGNLLPDTTKGADHYLTTRLLQSPKAPAWVRGRVPVVVIGAHTFFRLEAP